jgi:hypothetical protein
MTSRFILFLFFLSFAGATLPAGLALVTELSLVNFVHTLSADHVSLPVFLPEAPEATFLLRVRDVDDLHRQLSEAVRPP